MALLARSPAGQIAGLLQHCGPLPAHTIIRGPEGGLVMVRARAGGGGAAFNLGEMTVTRCTVRTKTGFVGHAYVAGREERRAELAALVDALMQDNDRRGYRDRNPRDQPRWKSSKPSARPTAPQKRPRQGCSSSPCRRCGHE